MRNGKKRIEDLHGKELITAWLKSTFEFWMLIEFVIKTLKLIKIILTSIL